jgi:hypothetical protein
MPWFGARIVFRELEGKVVNNQEQVVEGPE